MAAGAAPDYVIWRAARGTVSCRDSADVHDESFHGAGQCRSNGSKVTSGIAIRDRLAARFGSLGVVAKFCEAWRTVERGYSP